MVPGLDRPLHYRLEGHESVPCSQEEYLRWAVATDWEAGHRVALTVVNGKRISTVFLGLDHAFDQARPLLFESMVFSDGSEDDEAGDEERQERYSTWAEAEAGHAALVEEYSRGARD